MKLVEYPKCGTCRKARKWLDEQGIKYESRHIVEENPTANELQLWIIKSDKPLLRFLNTSGMKYRELGLAQKKKTMTDEELLDLMATDGMLVKRPILITDKGVLVGFKPDEWTEYLK